MATPGNDPDQRGSGYIYIIKEVTPRGTRQYYRVGHCAHLHARLLRLSTANPLGLSVIASFLVNNMLAAEQAAKSALSSTPELQLNDLGGDGDWYFGTDGTPAIRDIVSNVLKAASKHLLEEPASTIQMSIDPARTTQEQPDKAYLVSTVHNDTPCFMVVESHGNHVLLEINENNPTRVESKELLESDYKTGIQNMKKLLNEIFRTGQVMNGWSYGTGPEKLSIQDIFDRQKGWCSIM